MKIGLVGRTNVGKSTIFNRLYGSFRAIVTEIPGTTRELLVEPTKIRGKSLMLCDSPGLEEFEQELVFIKQIIEEADILLFVVDGKLDVSEQDLRIKQEIISAGKKNKTVLVVNKLDAKVHKAELILADYYALGFGRIVPLSAKQEDGFIELWDEVDGVVAEQ